MPPPKYRVQVATYNGHLGKGSNPIEQDLSSWLIPTLAEGSDEYTSEDPPDLFAIGFQEMIPLHMALFGLTTAALNLHDDKIKAAIENRTSSASGFETYTLMAKKVVGGIAILVYTRDRTVTSKVADVRVAHASCGIFRLMGNKGGVGVRIALDDEEETGKNSDGDAGEASTGNTVFTFATAHLAAHDSGLERRNQDWRSIVERLVFSDDSPSENFSPKKVKDIFSSSKHSLKHNGGGIQLYDTSYLFFFGDLNYRISTKTPKPLNLRLLAHRMINDMPGLLLQDQLAQEQSKGKTLHHLKEGPITFKPTYKYKVGTVSEFKKFEKRVPGWTDRILYATWADGEDGAGTITKKVKGDDGEVQEKVAKRKGAKVELYRSVMSFTRSDHKPVTAIISLPRAPKGSRNLRLAFNAPFRIDPTWRRKQLIGWFLDRFVGFFWCIIMFAGFNKDARLGMTNLIGASLAYYYREIFFGVI